VTGKLKSNTRE